MVRENISAVCGVPSTVLGLPDANYATARQATITYWEIQEKRAKKLEQFMTRIARLFDPAFHVQIDFHNVDALQFIRTEKLDRITLHMNAGMTASEAYAYEGLTDSPFRETELEEASQTEETIEQALSELLQRSETQKKNSNSYEIRGSVGDKDPSNFPDDGQDQQVALRNSEYERFPHDEALAIKEDWPQIWNKGGNILGNKQFKRLLPIANRKSSIAQTRTEEKAIRLREAWSARHYKDFRLAGVVAQIKWLTVGSRGLSHMRKVISEEKKRLTESRSLTKSMTKVQKDVYWKQWMQKSVVPAERTMKRAVEIYLEDASARYARRAEKLAQAIVNQQQNKAINYTTILGRAFEIEQIGKVIGRAYRSVYLLTGNDTVTNLYNMTGKTKPLDLLFGERAILERQILEFARQINATNEKQIKRVVRSGIEQGLSNAEIGEKIRQSTTFSQARAQRIAQTETTKAINTATNESYKQFEKEEDVKVLKEWISSRDDKVRDTHKILDDDAPIPVDNDFNVDGYSGPAPASFGVASMDINCRCTIAPVIIED